MCVCSPQELSDPHQLKRIELCIDGDKEHKITGLLGKLVLDNIKNKKDGPLKTAHANL